MPVSGKGEGGVKLDTATAASLESEAGASSPREATRRTASAEATA